MLQDDLLPRADLRNADLRRADLTGLNLFSADLCEADLREADLRRTNLCCTNLRNADLTGADLRGADLTGANLTGANLTGVQAILGITPDPALPAHILAQVTHRPETWDQTTWHSPCGTKHCIAGWACVLSGPLGTFLDAHMGTATAATLLLWHAGLVLPSLKAYATEDETLGRLQTMVAALASRKDPQQC
jgi:hypothetical protein